MAVEILLIDDDPIQTETISAAIQGVHPGATVTTLETESDFYDYLEKNKAQPAWIPSLVVCDVMLPWAFPSPDAASKKAPDDVVKGTYRKAGVRCWSKLRQEKQLKEVPWIYFTVLEAETIGFDQNRDSHTRHVRKEGNLEVFKRTIGEFLSLDSGWNETSGEVTRQFLASTKMRQILTDGLSTPLSECTRFSF